MISTAVLAAADATGGFSWKTLLTFVGAAILLAFFSSIGILARLRERRIEDRREAAEAGRDRGGRLARRAPVGLLAVRGLAIDRLAVRGLAVPGLPVGPGRGTRLPERRLRSGRRAVLALRGPLAGPRLRACARCGLGRAGT